MIYAIVWAAWYDDANEVGGGANCEEGKTVVYGLLLTSLCGEEIIMNGF